MQYSNQNSRSDTRTDSASQFTPGSFLGRGVPQTLRGRMRLSGLGFWDTMFPSEVSAEAGSPGSTSGFNWNNLLSDAVDLYTAKTQADLTKDLYALNVQRAQQGLQPISASQVSPQMNVGMARDTQNTLMVVALGGAAILGGAYMFGAFGKGRRRRR